VHIDEQTFIYFGCLVVAVILHEISHGVVALWFGDRTAKEAGRLTLNPVPHIDPFGSIVLPAMGAIVGLPVFGYAKPVPVNPNRLHKPRRDMLYVSLAGPATNLVFALLVAIPFWLGGGTQIGFMNGQLFGPHAAFWVALAALGFLQVTASVLNFLPVPGLDGGNMLHPWMSPAYQRAYNLFAPYGFILLFVLLWQSKINVWFFALVSWLSALIGVPDSLGEIGLAFMRFWQSL
jgi:Zn-dependent protease